MHPQIVSDTPGNCPICGMKLTPVAEEPVGGTGARKIVGYRHPMRPAVVSPTPAKDEMGMEYVPIYEVASPARGTGGPPLSAAPPEHAPFNLSTARQQLIGVRRATVQY